ncbi:hypothetical protein VPNG_07169 [Cytospora leucostoma]|uniref:MIF4G domain-containing protein n=1 Tax=Cytospora leucostoma TaxID=1230097 RepID=A0A423WJR9_9PEZI|nr:hypothetical protein VPNG_07169 [Cytospora leucostoma]
MASRFNTVMLSICRFQCLRLIHDLDSAPHPSNLHPRVENLHSVIVSMMKTITSGSEVVQGISVERSEDVQAIFAACAALLNDLQMVWGLYKVCSLDGWKLNNKAAERALHLDITSDPFDGIGRQVETLAYLLPYWMNSEMAHQNSQEIWTGWVRSVSDIINELERRIDIARELATINWSASRLQQSLDPATNSSVNDTVGSSCDKKTKSVTRDGQDEAWDSLGAALAGEGLLESAIECCQKLAQGKTPRWEPLDQGPTGQILTPAVSTPTSTKDDNASGSDTSGGLLNSLVVTSVFSADFEMLRPENYDSVAPKILDIALQSVAKFRRVLKTIYESACRDPCRAVICVRFARHLERECTLEIRKRMGPSRDFWGNLDDLGPVTRYLLNQCWSDWNNGKNGRPQISAEHFALGLTSFICRLLKCKSFQLHYAHIFIKKILEPNPPIGTTQFVALHHLLMTVGCMIEGPKRPSEDMSGYFERIQAIIDLPGASKQLKTLGRELQEMRRLGWRAEKRRVKSLALSQAVAQIKEGSVAC